MIAHLYQPILEKIKRGKLWLELNDAVSTGIPGNLISFTCLPCYLSQLFATSRKVNLKNSKPKVTDFEHESLFEVYKYSMMIEPTRSCVSRANKSNVP